MGDSTNYREGAPSGVPPVEEQDPPQLSRQTTLPLVWPSSARGDREGLTRASAGLQSQARDANGRDHPLRDRLLPIGTRRTYGPAWSRPAVRATNPPTDHSEAAPDYVDQVSPWDRESLYYAGRLRGEAAVNFRHGLYMGSFRLWQDLRRPSSLARRLLADGDTQGLDGYVRWSRYNRDRRLQWCSPPPVDATPVPALPVRSGEEGSEPGASDGGAGDSNVQLPA